jgi:glycosyltransferase involved in cell wall biosynthesis
MLSPMTIGLLGQTLFRKPLVVNPHASGSIGDVGVLKRQGPVGRGRLRAAVRRADAFIGISGPIRSELTEIGVPASRIWAIPNGVDTDHFRPAEPGERARLRAELGLPPGRIVVYAGRLSRQKGVDILLDAWARLPGLPAHLTVLGDGEETAALRAQAASLDRVHFLGATGDVAPYLRAADAFALGSRVEGLSVAVLEAMASGLSIAATAVGGTPEVLEDGITGRLVPGEDPQAMAHAIHETTCSEEAVRWAQRAREVAVRKYSIDQVAVRYEELYTRLMAGHNGNGAPGKRR